MSGGLAKQEAGGDAYAHRGTSDLDGVRSISDGARVASAPAPASQAAGLAAVSRIANEERYPVRHVPPLPEGILRRGDRFDGVSDEQWLAVNRRALQEGPNLIGPLPIHVAGVFIRNESFFAWVSGGQICEWLSAEQLPRGRFRRGEWLIWNDGRSIEWIHDRITDEEEIGKRTGRKGRDLARMVEAAQELNRDLEHFVATGSSIEVARKQTEDAHKEVLSELIQGAFAVYQTWASVEELAQFILTRGPALGRGFPRGGGVAAAREQHQLAGLMKRSEQVVREFPHLGTMPPTEENLAGLRRLTDLFDDAHLSPTLREQFITEAKAAVGGKALAPTELHSVLCSVAHAKPEVYLRQGPHASAAELEGMGGLARAVSLKSVLANLTTEAWFQRARGKISGLPVDRAQLDWKSQAPLLVEEYRSGRLPFDPSTDLDPAALVKGASESSSGWFFANADAGHAIDSPKLMQTRLAVGADYEQGYLLMELPAAIAEAHGAARPTALDLTLSPLGRLNASSNEHVGRTAPTVPGQRSVREVILPPLPLSMMSSIRLVTAR